MSITITPAARDRISEVLRNPTNEGAKLRVVFEGYG
jgi:Fe-S cluster assembly iron-binding protein IscA